MSEKVQGGSEGHTKSRGKPLANKRDRAKDGKDEEEGGKKKSPRAEVDEKKVEEEDDDDVVVVVERASSAQAIEVEGEGEGGEKEQKDEEVVVMEEDKDKEAEKEEEAVSMEVEEANEEPEKEEKGEEAEGEKEGTVAVAKTPNPKPSAAKGSAKRSRTSSAKKKAALASAPESELERKYREQLDALLATTPMVTLETQADYRLGVEEAMEALLKGEGEKKEEEVVEKEAEKEEEGEKEGEKEGEDKMEQDGEKEGEEEAAKADEATEEPAASTTEGGEGETEAAVVVPVVSIVGGGEVPEAVVPLLARLIQGSHLPLTQLAEGVLGLLSERLVPCVESLSLQGVMDKIRLLAERKCYGQKPKAAIVAEDMSPEALWVWELAEITHLPEAGRAVVKEVRGERTNVGRLIKALIKLIEVRSHTQLPITKKRRDQKMAASFYSSLSS